MCSESNQNGEATPPPGYSKPTSLLWSGSLGVVHIAENLRNTVLCLVANSQALHFPRAVSRESLRRRVQGGQQTDLQRNSVCGPHSQGVRTASTLGGASIAGEAQSISSPSLVSLVPPAWLALKPPRELVLGWQACLSDQLALCWRKEMGLGHRSCLGSPRCDREQRTG